MQCDWCSYQKGKCRHRRGQRMVQRDGGTDLQAKEWWGAPTKPRSQETDVGQVLPTAIRETRPGILGL